MEDIYWGIYEKYTAMNRDYDTFLDNLTIDEQLHDLYKEFGKVKEYCDIDALRCQ